MAKWRDHVRWLAIGKPHGSDGVELKPLGHLVCALGLVSLLAATSWGAESFDSAYISEVLAVNRRGLKDDDGERSGWIEIHNGGSVPVELNGWFLTDTPTHLTRWRFPRVVILPDKSITVFASGKDRTNDLNHLHASFRTGAAGGWVGLVNRATNVVSQVSYPPVAADVAFGSVRGEPGTRGLLSQPTPGRANIAFGAGFAAAITFSATTRTFIDAVEVKLSCDSTGAVIRYTLDGTLPTTNSPAYAAPMTFTNTTQLRARAFAPGLLPGPPRSESYLKLFSDAVAFTSSLPVLVIDTFGKDVPVSSHHTFAQLACYEPVNGKTSLTNAPTLTTRGGFRSRGSSSAGMPQPSYAIEFLDEFNRERDLSPLGLPADSDWILYAPNSFDPVLIHNPFVHQLSRDMGRYSPRTRFVEVFVVRSAGRVRATYYAGLYVLEEKIKIGKHRVNISRLSADDAKPPQVTGGYLLKFDRLGPDEMGFSAGGPDIVFVEPREQVISLPQRRAQKQYIRQYFSDFYAALNGTDYKDPEHGYRAFLDVPAAIDFHVLEVLSGNVDAMVLSTHFYKPRNGKIVCGPHWDFDRALGSTDGRDDNPRNWNTGPFFGGTWWPRLFSDVDFWQLWVDRWQELRAREFALFRLHGLVDQLTAEIKESQPRQYQKWGFNPRGGSYQAEVDHMKRWLSNRVDFIDQQLVPLPVLSFSNRTMVLFAPTNATIYYTLDGSDPRLAQGAIATNALRYTGAVPVKASAALTARAYNPQQRQTDGPPTSTPWSGPLRTNVVAAP